MKVYVVNSNTIWYDEGNMTLAGSATHGVCDSIDSAKLLINDLVRSYIDEENELYLDQTYNYVELDVDPEDDKIVFESVLDYNDLAEQVRYTVYCMDVLTERDVE